MQAPALAAGRADRPLGREANAPGIAEPLRLLEAADKQALVAAKRDRLSRVLLDLASLDDALDPASRLVALLLNVLGQRPLLVVGGPGLAKYGVSVFSEPFDALPAICDRRWGQVVPLSV